MAAPFVSGVAALFWSKNPGFAVNEIRDLLQNTALDLGDAGKDNIYGYGLVQAN
jgi:subtilisin family serine protease